MERNKTVKEKYEYSILRDDIDGIARASVSALKMLLMVILGLGAGAAALCLLGELYILLTCSVSVIGFASLIIVFSMRNTYKNTKAQKDFPETRSYKLRIYDDFLVIEVSEGNNISLLCVTPLSSVSITGENDKYLMATCGVYIVPIPKSLLNPNSVIVMLYNLKGKKLPQNPYAPKYFAEPAENRLDHEAAEEKDDTRAGLTYTVSLSNGISEYEKRECSAFDISDAEETVNYDACEENTVSNKEKQKSAYNASEPESSANASAFDAGSFSSYERNLPHDEHTPYLYEPFAHRCDNKKLKMAGSISFGLSIVSIFLAFIGSLFSSLFLTANIVPTLIISLIPVSSIAIGVFLLKRGEPCAKNIIAGVLTLFIVLSMIETNPVIIDDTMEEDAAAFTESIEKTLKIDIPELEDVYFYAVKEGENYKELTASPSAETSAKIIEYAKANPDKFITSFPSEYIGLLPTFDRDNEFSVALLYNTTANEFNSLPEKDGTYDMIYVVLYEYEDGYAYFKAIEYEIEYSTKFNQ